MAAVVLAAALVFAVGVADAQAPGPGPEIDTGATVQQGECSPCHLTLGQVDEPGLIFDHGNHLLISCEGCHSRFPHRPGGSVERVPMETCFACHGVQHGPTGELATGACEDCHTKSFTLRPKTHVKSWEGAPHAEAAAKTGVNGCMMCHTASTDCNECHRDEDVDIPPIEDTYHSVVPDRVKKPSVQIYPEGDVTMAQCVYCHPDIDEITPGRLIFAHAEHLRRNYDCETCHQTFPHDGEGNPDVPDMLSCYRCHGFEHASQGMVAGEDCGKCHPPEFELMPPDHTTEFARGEHKKRAESDPAYCAMCHKSQFCVDCHTGKKVSPNAPGTPVIPKDHTDAKWQGEHGKLFLQEKGSCGSCHDGPSCQECHQTVMPHPVGWAENHVPPEGIPNTDCNICHRDRRDCQECHHSRVAKSELIEENCTPCHDQMSQKPATSIKHKGYSEHAVHFGVKESKGRAYKCYECHVDFGSSAAAEKLELQQGHDLRLCYDCHGALDPYDKPIAPYKGAGLCLRCHDDLGV